MNNRSCAVKDCNRKAIKNEFACDEHLSIDVLKFNINGRIITGLYISDSSTQIKIKVLTDSEFKHNIGREDEIHKDWLDN